MAVQSYDNTLGTAVFWGLFGKNNAIIHDPFIVKHGIEAYLKDIAAQGVSTRNIRCLKGKNHSIPKQGLI